MWHVILVYGAVRLHSAHSQVATKSVIDFCSVADPHSCGPGVCVSQRYGKSLSVPDWMDGQKVRQTLSGCLP
ncbi:hypothetical protein KIN20_002363 [Parelaphostrongylus tenuis]|uniref:Uncharacterized protein n=1 Tax=Parelaphostrongylus tenuis TaxID=148309 RepID=A0AAD5LZP2_PARTN|nr:hypothetical protein KIN20_002363 [Parelaphostrongylus tenuis]